ncbi:methionine aminopeptidase, type I [Plasmodium falciparum Santa Lucia]|uniref:Methionine aminopeptidase n=5 Tax=Plasmodium falciparum TaxID=5833 RepID=A0A024W7E6_PLAFA|nr:methionine aminopeptidase, type I [Plasmodium falciparum Tanzania (2000708)]ETW49137.1 methionine aminopeptidase, type I [Plasmodium falciparum MaliPS096_E11]EUT85791.1 methionine aminopeptidase, type I [Plasmodium falciparum Santa Lucia]EWC76408.1 methionine aminopeptidase, type I [Plasmodium falciparum UGT5.1]KNG74695.1 methionine aminopeptidase [Plasmodium falciparum IGH-CR14]
MANIDDIEKQIENIKINSDDNKNNVSKNKNILLNGVNLKDHEIKDNVKSVDYNNNNNENDTMNEINKHVKNDEYCNKENSNNNNNNNNNLDTQINETLNLNEKFEKKNEENLCSGCKKVLIKKLSCPICLKNKIFSYFCNQECFKGSWKEHQKIHENMNKENNEKEDHLKTIVKKHLSPENFDPTNRKYWVYDDHLKNFVNFKFTGDVRPWPLSKINHVPSHIERPDYAISSIPESELIYKRKSDIYVNNEEEIQRIREACILGRKTLDYAHTLVSPGVTTDEIDRKVHEFIIKNNAYPSTLNYYKFPKSCCTSVNEIVCHGIPDYRPLKSGDIINIDISVFYKGVHSDLNETYFVGDINDVPKEGKELVETCYFSLMEAIKKCKPGMFYKNIGTLIDAYVSKKNFSVVRSYSGHGVGKLFHSNPTVPHFKKNKAVGIMKPGHVFTIEPMINQGHYSDVLWPDQWTSATSDGKLSAQFEHTLLITNNGVEILTKRTQDSPPLGFDTKDELYYN